MHKKIIIIGSSAAGIGAINALRQLDAHASITCISDESELPYNKCSIADYVGGIKTEQQTYTYSAEKAREKNIVFMLGKRVQHIDRIKKVVALNDGQELVYDALFIGTGASPIVPAIDGIHGTAGIFSFHTLRDAQRILEYGVMHKPRTAVVLGSGLSGLEIADALLAHNMNVTLIEKAHQILPGTITPACSHFIKKAMEQHSVTLLSNLEVIRVHNHHGHVQSVELSDGCRIAADMLVIAVGSKPNSVLAQQAGIDLIGASIAVDEHMRTSDASIYAGGDVVKVTNLLTGDLVQSRTWPDAMLQGLVAGHNMTGTKRAYPGIAPVLSSAFFGLKFAQCGLMSGFQTHEQLTYKEIGGSRYTLRCHGDRLKGFCLIGDTSKLGALKRAILIQEIIAPERYLEGL